MPNGLKRLRYALEYVGISQNSLMALAVVVLGKQFFNACQQHVLNLLASVLAH